MAAQRTPYVSGLCQMGNCGRCRVAGCHCPCGHKIQAELPPGRQAEIDAMIQQIHECREAGKLERQRARELREARKPAPGADTPEGAAEAVPVAPKGRAVRVPQRCHCGCGGKTKGGMFVAGHDMRLKGRLFEVARDPNALMASRDPAKLAAIAELIARGWKLDKIPAADLRAARAEKYGWNMAPDLVIERRVAQRYQD